MVDFDMGQVATAIAGLRAVSEAMNLHVDVHTPGVTVNVPEQPTPIVNVYERELPAIHVPPPVINVAAPEAPIVNVTTPEVTVNVPEAKAALVQDIRIVDMPPSRATVKRDRNGRIVEVDSE
jgi:hypothetical protein